MSKIIMHIDLNAFFATAETIKNPELIGKPLIVAGTSRRGIVSTASYEARKYGIHSAMPTYQARRLCPDVIICPGDYELYSRLSHEFFSYIKTYTGLVEVASVDECYCDMTECMKDVEDPLAYLKNLQNSLYEKTKLKCSIGLAPTKFLAKMASDMKKPMGITIIRRKDVKRILWPIKIQDMYGVGKKTYPRLQRLGIYTIGDLAKDESKEVKKVLGKMYDGLKLWANGYGSDEVDTEPFDPKSVGHSSTFLFDTNDYDEIKDQIITKWHSFASGVPCRLSAEQASIARTTKDVLMKVKGFAGSGKTQVMVQRAVNAHLRTGAKVLLLTYNVTLANYLKTRVGMVQADFSWNSFVICNFHRFVSNVEKQHGMKFSLEKCNNPDCLDHIKDEIQKFDTILIDEIQDYHQVWIEIIKKYFLAKNGEMVLFGDSHQSVYLVKKKDGEIIIPEEFGQWKELPRFSFRVDNENLVNLAVKFREKFLSYPSTTISLNGGNIFAVQQYRNVSRDSSPELITKLILSFIDNNTLDVKDTVVLSCNDDILREIDYCYRFSNKGEEQLTTTVFESKEAYDKLQDDQCGSQFRIDVDEIRTSKKLRFTMDNANLKICTIYSFKGWEAKNVILVIPPQKKGTADTTPFARTRAYIKPEIIYTAITRAKTNLFVINMGVEQYDDYFSKSPYITK